MYVLYLRSLRVVVLEALYKPGLGVGLNQGRKKEKEKRGKNDVHIFAKGSVKTVESEL